MLLCYHTNTLTNVLLEILFWVSQKALFNEQRLRTKLEEAVTNSAEDAQSQISAQTATVVKLEKLLISLQENFESTKQEAHTQIVSIIFKPKEFFEFQNCIEVYYYYFFERS